MDSKEKYESKLNAWKFQVVAVTVLLVITACTITGLLVGNYLL